MFGTLALIAFIAELLFLLGASIFVRRLRRLSAPVFAEDIRGTKVVLDKVRKREPISPGERSFAARAIADRRSPLAYCIPASIFTMGAFWVLGSLQQLHGNTPSERTFLGLIPMLMSFNVTIQLLKVAKLKRRLPTAP